MTLVVMWFWIGVAATRRWPFMSAGGSEGDSFYCGGEAFDSVRRGDEEE